MIVKTLMVLVAVAILWPARETLASIVVAGVLIWLAVCWHKHKQGSYR
jgi:hypothetical protein